MAKTYRKAKFKYYEEDCRCEFCLYRKGRKGCKLQTCCCDDIRRDAVKNGRITRPRGWNTYRA